MTDMEQDFRSMLTGHSALTALVGTRIYPIVLPGEVTLPAVTYSEIAGFSPTPTLTGDSGFVNGTMQVDAWATTYAGIKALKDAIVDAVNGKSYGCIEKVRVNLTLDTFEIETGRYRQLVDCQVNYDRS